MLPGGPILAGYDGSEGARDGLALTRAVAIALDRPVEVLSTLSYTPAVTVSEYQQMLAHDERRLAQEAKEALEGLDVTTLMIPGHSAARDLHDVAEAHQAALIVLGPTHRRALGRVLPGATAPRLLTAAPCAVAIAGRGLRERPLRLGHLVVAFDGSSESREALRMALAIGAGSGASIELVGVVELTPAIAMAAGWGGEQTLSQILAHEAAAAQAAIDEAIAQSQPGIQVTGRVVTDEAAATAIETAARTTDLLLVGSRGYGPLGRVLLGSVSSALLRTAACPVVITPRSATSV